MKIFAHRGARKNSFENTIPAIEYALSLSIDAIEIDLHCTRDKELVVHHDSMVRWHHRKTPIVELTLPQIREVVLAGRYKIPTLGEVITKVAHRKHLILEIKQQGIASRVTEMLKSAAYGSDISFTSFIHKELLAIRLIMPQVPVIPLYESAVIEFNAIQSMMPVGVSVNKEMVRDDVVRMNKEHNLETYVYTVNDVEMACRFRDMGVNGIFCDFPEEMIGKI